MYFHQNQQPMKKQYFFLLWSTRKLHLCKDKLTNIHKSWFVIVKRLLPTATDIFIGLFALSFKIQVAPTVPSFHALKSSSCRQCLGTEFVALVNFQAPGFRLQIRSICAWYIFTDHLHGMWEFSCVNWKKHIFHLFCSESQLFVNISYIFLSWAMKASFSVINSWMIFCILLIPQRTNLPVKSTAQRKKGLQTIK